MRLPDKEEDGVNPLFDRFRFDDEDEEETPLYFIDPFDADAMKARARLFPSMPVQAQNQAQLAARRAHQDAAAAASSNMQESSLSGGASQRRQSG